MKTLRILLVFILGLAISSIAMAGGNRGGYRGGGHHHHKGGTRWVVGVNVGFPGYYWGAGYGYWGGYWPWYGPAYYPYPYYSYYPAPVVVQQQPTTYIEQPAPQAQQQQVPTGYWYYCADPGAYYPYVKECPGGWQRVAPQPSN